MYSDSIVLADFAAQFEDMLEQAADQKELCRHFWSLYISTTLPSDPVAQMRRFIEFYRSTHQLRADVFPKNAMMTPLHTCAWYGYDIYLENLCKNAQDLKVNVAKLPLRTTPMHSAASRGNMACLLILKRYGANLNLLSADGSTLLHCAAEAGSDAIINFLLSSPEFTVSTAITNNGRSALHLAITAKSVPCVQLLGPRLATTKDRENNTILHYIVSMKSIEQLNLIQAFVPIMLEEPNRLGKTPLSIAIQDGSLEMVNQLLTHGAQCRAPGENRIDPLAFAAEKYFAHPFKRINKDIFLAVLSYAKEQQVDFADHQTLIDKLSTIHPEAQEDFNQFRQLVNQAVILRQSKASS